jgi:hypothetical protein
LVLEPGVACVFWFERRAFVRVEEMGGRYEIDRRGRVRPRE